ncbi:MAG: aldehyde dehydrogenase [Rhodobacteraceae bacterium]|nr:MAG: aldehyde dehydrogenase [Paracoccaceae bacterium]
MAGTIDRRAAVARLLEARNGALVVTGLGSPTYDVHAHGDSDDNYYLWGAMGGAALTGLGLAQAQPDRRVMVITGDGEMLMAFGALATISVAGPSNLDIIVLDNQHYGETGMQESHTGRGIDLAAVAGAAGFDDARTITTLDGVDTLCMDLSKPANGPRLYLLKIEARNLPRSLPPRDATFIKTRMRAHLGFQPC